MKILTLTMGPQLGITAVIPVIEVGSAATITFKAVGSAGIVKWSILNTNLPAEWPDVLVSSGSTADLICPSVLQSGDYFIEVRAVDDFRMPVIGRFDIRIENQSITITPSASTKTWSISVPVNDTFTVDGGSGVYTRAWATGDVPSWMWLDITGDTIALSGAPDEETTGSRSFKILVEDSEGRMGVADVSYTITVSWEWRSIAPYAASAWRNATLLVKDNTTAYVVGGGNPFATGNLKRYNSNTNTWTTLATAPLASSGYAIATLINSDDIFMVSYDMRYTVYTASTNTWSTPVSLPSAAAAAYVCAYTLPNGDVFIGTAQSYFLAPLISYRYSVSSGTVMTTATTGPHTNTNFCQLSDGSVMFYGGLSAAGVRATPVIYNYVSDTFTNTSPHPTSNNNAPNLIQRCSGGAIAIDRGGTSHYYNRSANTWTSVTPPSPSHNTGDPIFCPRADGTAVLAGGGSAPNNLVHVFNPSLGWIQLDNMINGRVLGMGGSFPDNRIIMVSGASTAGAEIYGP